MRSATSRPIRPRPARTPIEIKTFLEGSSGWGDASVLVPWETWRAYADRRLLEEQWVSMVAWVDYVIEAAREKRHAHRIARTETPEPHEQFLWDTGWHWGEWCEPDLLEDDHFASFADRDFAIVATAFFAYTTRTLAAIARILGRDDDAVRYDELSSNVVNAWRHEFVADDGTVRSDRQADVVRALAFDLVPDAGRDIVASQLVSMVRSADTHLNTGFLATPYLLPVLADSGHLDLAYELLFQDTPPSWLAMIDRGATTIWEHWEGIDADGVAHASLNHYSKGAVISFLHRYVAGIQLLDAGPGVPPLPRRTPPWRRPHVGERRARVALRTYRIVMVDRRDGDDVHGTGTAEHRSRGGAARRAHSRGFARLVHLPRELTPRPPTPRVVTGSGSSMSSSAPRSHMTTIVPPEPPPLERAPCTPGRASTCATTAVAASWPRPMAS